VTSREHKPATAAPPGGEGWQGNMPGLDRRDRRFKRSLRRQIVLAASAGQGTEVGAMEQKEVVVAFEYQQGTRGRSPRRRWGRRQRILLGLQAATLVVVAAGVLVVSRPPADQRPTAQELLGRALRVLDARPSGVVVHQVVTESSLGQNWPQWLAGTFTNVGQLQATPHFITIVGTGYRPNEKVDVLLAGVPTSTAARSIALTGSGFEPNDKVLVAFNAPYDATGAPIARGTMHSPHASAHTLRNLSPTRLEVQWAIDDSGHLYNPASSPDFYETATTSSGNVVLTRSEVLVSSDQIMRHPTRIESWRQLDSGGTMTRAVLTARDDRGALLRQVVIDDGSVAIYDSAGSTSGGAVVGYQRGPQFWLPDQGRGFVATPALKAARGVLLAMQHDTQARLLPEQRLDGHDVVVLASTGPVRPDFSRQVREEQRLYIDAQSYQVRGYDAIALERNVPPRLLYSVRVPVDEQLAQGDVPLDAYRFSPPTGTPLMAPRCENPPIALAAAAYGDTTPLLPSGYDGMKLQMLFSTQSPAGAVGITYLYQPSASASESLEVALLHGGTAGAKTGSAVIAPSVTVNMSGKQVRGVLVRTAPTSNEYTFSYTIGDSTIAVKGTNLGLPRFKLLLGAMRSGQAAIPLQDRLDTDLAVAGMAGTATGC